MKKRSEKEKDVEQLKTELAKVSTVILTTFQGISVDEDTKLRRAVQAAGGRYRVLKNTLAERAGVGTPAEQGRVLSIEEIRKLAQLPSKEELFSKIMFSLQAPAQRIAAALAAISRNLAATLNAAVDANKFESGGGSEPVGAAQE